MLFRDADAKGRRALPGLNTHLAAVFSYGAQGGVESKAGSLADAFSCKEGLKNVRQHVGGNSRAVTYHVHVKPSEDPCATSYKRAR